MKSIKKIIKTREISFAEFLCVLVLGIALNFSFSTPAQATDKPEKLSVAAYAGDTGLLVYLAQAQEYFSHNGLDVTISDYEAGKLAVDALLAGEVDLATAADFVFVTQKFEHPDLVSIGTIAIADTMGLVARKDSGIKKCGDLKGKRVGVTQKSSGEFNLGLFLLACGLSMNDVDIVDLNPGEMVQAIFEGRIDAVETWEPGIYEIKKKLGENAIISPNQLDHHFYFILICRKSWLKKHQKTAEHFLKSLVAAEAYARNEPKAARAFAQTEFGLDPQYVDYIFPKHQFR